MSKFLYNQKILITTEYVEAMALYIYCLLNNLDFIKFISLRKIEDLKKFPDFVIGQKYLEVVRALDELDGKQQKDVVEVFGQKDIYSSVAKKNNELEIYKIKNHDHRIKFGIFNGVRYATSSLITPDTIIDNIVERIALKNHDIKSKSINKEVDLFVINTHYLSDDNVKKITGILKRRINQKQTCLLFNKIYVNFLEDNEHIKVLIIDNDYNYDIKKVKCKLDKNYIAKLILNFGWINKKDYLI